MTATSSGARAVSGAAKGFLGRSLPRICWVGGGLGAATARLADAKTKAGGTPHQGRAATRLWWNQEGAGSNHAAAGRRRA